MSRVMAHDKLAQLQAAALPRLTWQEVFSLKEGATLTPEDDATLTAYFAHFTPSPGGNCICCETRIFGDEIEHALGIAHFEWGLMNGEGHCASCEYPARVYHRNIGPIRFLNRICQYHPAELVRQEGRE